MNRETIIETVRILNDLQDVARAISVATKLMTKQLEAVEGDLVELLVSTKEGSTSSRAIRKVEGQDG